MTLRTAFGGLSWTAVATIMALAPAWAQDAATVEAVDPDTAVSDEPMTEAERRGIETMTVTAQRTEESLLDVPVSVTAFGAENLDFQQIDTFSDLQFNVPNVTFTKTNFTGTNFQIRGVGSTLTAASADSGVAIHVNDVFLQQPRIFEIEYFDIERLEVLRGPQGTLYGRNATGGSVNLITARPDLENFGFNVQAQYGNFSHRRVKGHVNIPIVEDKLGVRIAGIYLKRDGYTENIFNGNDIDDRDQYAIRGSVRWTPTETTTIDVIGSYFKEDSSRTRSTKQLCNNDPSNVLGCLPDKLAFETVNASATLGGLLVTDLVLGPLALAPFFGFDNEANGIVNPRDLRKTNLDFDPVYEADETFVMVQIEQQLREDLTLTLTGSYQETMVFSNQDYNNTVAAPAVVPDLVAELFPQTFATYFADGLFPVSAIDRGQTGVIGGNIRSRSPFLEAYDQSSGNGEQYSVEARLASSFDGPFNFQLAAYYLDYTSDGDYYVVAGGLDYFALLGSGVDGLALYTPFFNSETDEFALESYAVFGEVYYNILENLKVTGGMRYTVDEKFVRDRQIPLVSGGVVPIGTESVLDLLATGHDGDAGTPGQQAFREDTVTFREITGRFVIDWAPDVPFTDSTLVYASYSRGYKGGGLNPPIDPALFPNVPSTFEPEFLNAYEIGTKNELFDGRLQASLTGFYYDYTGLQVGKIVARTSLNENIDATIWGLEGEFLAAPWEDTLFNMNVSYLNTEITDADSVDGRDPTDGSSDVTLIKDLSNTSNCVVEHNGNPDPVSAGLLDGITAAGLPYIPVETPGIAFAALSTCAGLQAFFDAAGLDYGISDGVPADLTGNELQNAPKFTLSLGGQYSHYFNVGASELSLVGRVDYYWQGDMFARIFNKPIDRIESYDQLNLQMTLFGPEQSWFVRGFVQNVLNSDNITGHYFTDPSSGNFTNIFVLEPRLYGLEVGYTF